MGQLNNKKFDYSDSDLDSISSIDSNEADEKKSKDKDEIKTISEEKLNKEFPNFFLHCRKCYRTYIFKISLSNENNNTNYYVTFKCSCFQTFQRTTLLNFMKLLETPWKHNISAKTLIHADTVCKIHNKVFISFCSTCFEINCQICEKKHNIPGHNLIKLENLFLYYRIDNDGTKDEETTEIIKNADKAYNILINKNKNSEEKETIKKLYINWVENNASIYILYKELFSYYPYRSRKNNFAYIYDYIVNTSFRNESDNFLFSDEVKDDDILNLYKTSCIIYDNTPNLLNIINMKYGIKNKIHKGKIIDEDSKGNQKYKFFIKTMAKLNDENLLIITNEDIAQIYLIRTNNISLITEFKLSSNFILPLKNSNNLFSIDKNYIYLLEYKKFGVYNKTQKLIFNVIMQLNLMREEYF